MPEQPNLLGLILKGNRKEHPKHKSERKLASNSARKEIVWGLLLVSNISAQVVVTQQASTEILSNYIG
jgi:hypothetical protein